MILIHTDKEKLNRELMLKAHMVACVYSPDKVAVTKDRYSAPAVLPLEFSYEEFILHISTLFQETVTAPISSEEGVADLSSRLAYLVAEINQVAAALIQKGAICELNVIPVDDIQASSGSLPMIYGRVSQQIKEF